MENLLLKYVRTGRIRDLAGLKRAYRKAVLKTHPDAVGSDRLVGSFLQLRRDFDEARGCLAEERGSDSNHRYLFFQCMHLRDQLESPYYLDKQDLERRLEAVNYSIREHFMQWRADRSDEFAAAQREYEGIKKEKPPNAPYRRDELYQSLKPVMFNIANYHLTGLEFYRRQLKQNLDSIVERLEDKRYRALKEHLLFLVRDLEDGPALFG